MKMKFSGNSSRSNIAVWAGPPCADGADSAGDSLTNTATYRAACAIELSSTKMQ